MHLNKLYYKIDFLAECGQVSQKIKPPSNWILVYKISKQEFFFDTVIFAPFFNFEKTMFLSLKRLCIFVFVNMWYLIKKNLNRRAGSFVLFVCLQYYTVTTGALFFLLKPQSYHVCACSSSSEVLYLDSATQSLLSVDVECDLLYGWLFSLVKSVNDHDSFLTFFIPALKGDTWTRGILQQVVKITVVHSCSRIQLKPDVYMHCIKTFSF